MAYARVNMFYERESWRKPLALSFGFHALLGLTIFVLGFVLAPRSGSNWGEKQGDAVTAQLVSSAPIPIPKPDIPTDNIVANDTKAVTQTPPQPKATETEDGVTIPGQVTKPKIDKVITKANVQPHPLPTPATAVPYGEGGPVTGPYAAFTAPNTKGGFSFQNSDFGSRFGWYQTAVTNKISSVWYQAEIDPHVTSAKRVYLLFDIQRDGTPVNVRIEQSSGIPSLDQSALRALQRIDGFGRLPPEYNGSKVSVEFWFDYQR
jgi:protein TonB